VGDVGRRQQRPVFDDSGQRCIRSGISCVLNVSGRSLCYLWSAGTDRSPAGAPAWSLAPSRPVARRGSGAHGAWCWSRTRADLVWRGDDVFAVDLPLTGLDDDAAALRRALDAWGRDAVLVGHSYAGLVISKAATERPDVQHLVYVAAMLVHGGDVYLKRMSEFPAAPINDEVELTADGNFVVRAETAVRCFYNECARGEAEDGARRLRADGGSLRGRADRRRTVEVDPVDLRAVRTRSRHPPGLSEMDVHSSWRGRDA
jgi:pimeloyl-ACP methyl ester carboxylesterase